MSLPQVLLLLGPTASGKTELATRLADSRPVDLINMDSAQVYRGLDIGTAKPTPAEQARYPHALIDICDPAEVYSAARFVADADAAVRRALAQDRLPVLVGGTMLYGRAFRDGLTVLPAAAPAERMLLEAEADERGLAALHGDLEAVDAAAAAQIHPHNRQRLLRALEVYRVSGRPLSAWWRELGARSAAHRLGVEAVCVGLSVDDRAQLHERIAARFRLMLEQGLLAEVAGLRARGDLHPELPSMRAVGYRQCWECLDGRWPEAALADRGIAATRQLAKRQLTWLRAWNPLHRLPAEDLWASAGPRRSADREPLALLLGHLAK